MSDEASLTEGQADSTSQDSGAQHDWEKDYKELQAEYTRSQQASKEAQAIWDDEDAVLARIREKHPHLMTTEDEPAEEIDEFDDDDQVSAMQRRLDEQDQRWQQHETKETEQSRTSQWQGWEEYVRETAKQQGVDLTARDIKALKIDSIGKDGFPLEPDNAKTVLGEHLAEREEELKALGVRRKPNPAPHMVAGGEPAVPAAPDWSKMSQDEQVEHMVARARALESQTQ